MSRVITRTGSINNHRAQSGKADSAKSCRIAFALFHRFKYPLRDDSADTVGTARSAELRTCQLERLIHYSGVATEYCQDNAEPRCIRYHPLKKRRRTPPNNDDPPRAA